MSTTMACPHCGQPIEPPPPPAPVDVNDLAFVSPAEPIAIAPLPAPPGKSSVALALVAPYAVLMTVVAATFAYKYYSAGFEHPLALIPDLVGEYRNATERKAGAHVVPLPRPDQPLPDELITSLGKPLAIGQIEITPLKIEQRPWTAFSQRKAGEEPKSIPIKETLVLTLRIKNTSPDLLIYPMDPYFDRRPSDDSKAMPFTLIDADGQKYYGGVLPYGGPSHDWLEGRADDGTPLGPGEEREVVLVTRPTFAPEIVDALQSTGGSAVWRVHVRRGLYAFQGHEYSVAAVIGVRFAASDVTGPQG